MKGFSIIIPTLNRTDFLLNTLKDIVIQVFEHPYEIIIVDQSNTIDQSVLEIAKKNQTINYQHITSFRGLPEARNYGASMATYEHLLFIDDDIKCDQNLLAEHHKFLSNNEIGVVAGGITEVNNENKDCEIGKFISYSATPLRGFHKKSLQEVDHAGGGNFSVKKSVFNAVNGIDENLTKGAALYEETDFCLRVKKTGLKIYYNYDAHVFHLAASTGGCRVPDISKYVYALTRNRTFIIKRHLGWHHKFSAHLVLLKLVLSYQLSYKSLNVLSSYLKGLQHGSRIQKSKVLNSFSSLQNE